MTTSFEHAEHIDTVIFDLDDTLIDWTTIDYRGAVRERAGDLKFAIEGQGIRVPFDLDSFTSMLRARCEAIWAYAATHDYACLSFHDVLECFLRDLNLEGDVRSIDELIDIYGRPPDPPPAAHDGAVEVLKELRARGYRLGLITNSFFPLRVRAREMRARNRWEYFRIAITAGDAGYFKPSQHIFELALDLLDTKPERSLMVGDSLPSDIYGAAMSGMAGVHFAPNGWTTGGPTRFEPAARIARLQELLELLPGAPEYGTRSIPS
ncbi:MAG: HAD family hydrolase [Myxococcota bacterium]